MVTGIILSCASWCLCSMRADPVTRGLIITVDWLGINVDVSYLASTNSTITPSPSIIIYSQVVFWSQHVSFILVGVIVITSVRGLLITLTKVYVIIKFLLSLLYISTLCSSSMLLPVPSHPTSYCFAWLRSWYIMPTINTISNLVYRVCTLCLQCFS